VPPLAPDQTQNRFNLAFSQFIGVLATAEHPLVLFLDDLHWADVASLNLLAHPELGDRAVDVEEVHGQHGRGLRP
jgi:predicted ATPase